MSAEKLGRLQCPECRGNGTWRFVGQDLPLDEEDPGQPIWSCEECGATNFGDEPIATSDVHAGHTGVQIPAPESQGECYHTETGAAGHRTVLGTLADAELRGLNYCDGCNPPRP